MFLPFVHQSYGHFCGIVSTNFRWWKVKHQLCESPEIDSSPNYFKRSENYCKYLFFSYLTWWCGRLLDLWQLFSSISRLKWFGIGVQCPNPFNVMLFPMKMIFKLISKAWHVRRKHMAPSNISINVPSFSDLAMRMCRPHILRNENEVRKVNRTNNLNTYYE